MHRNTWSVALALVPALTATVIACGDDDVFEDRPGSGDGGLVEAGPRADADLASPDAGDGASSEPSCGDVTGVPARILVTNAGPTAGELVAVNSATKQVDGRLPIPSAFGGSVVANNREPFVVAQEADTVSRLDAKEPWKVVSSWSVRGADAVDGGKKNANPWTVVVPTCTKGYVVRFNRNQIAVLDTTETVTNGAPKKFIDLSSFVQPADSDGYVDMTNAVYVPAKKRLFVLLGNMDLKKVASDGFTALCTAAKPAIVAIDTDTDQVVGAPMPLSGSNPSGPLVYDAVKDRLLVLMAGCNKDEAGAAGPVERRRVEELDLKTGDVETLVSLDGKGFPTSFEYVDATHAAIGVFGQTFFWDPTKTELGAEIPGLGTFASDGRGALVGARATFHADGGAGPLEIVSAPLDGGTATVITKDPFTDNTSWVNSVAVWPRP